MNVKLLDQLRHRQLTVAGSQSGLRPELGLMGTSLPSHGFSLSFQRDFSALGDPLYALHGEVISMNSQSGNNAVRDTGDIGKTTAIRRV